MDARRCTTCARVCIEAFRVLHDLPEAGAAGAGRQGRGLPEGAAARRLEPMPQTCMPGATPSAPYKHLMQRVDVKMLDALLEPPAEGRLRRRRRAARRWPQRSASTTSPRWTCASRSIVAAKPSSRAATKLLRTDAGRRRGDACAPCSRASASALRPGRASSASMTVHGREPRAAQDEVRPQPGHGARCQSHADEKAQPGLVPARTLAQARCPACGCADPASRIPSGPR